MTGRQLTREEAVRRVYHLLRHEETLAAIEAAALLFALGITLTEIDAAMREYGDL